MGTESEPQPTSEPAPQPATEPKPETALVTGASAGIGEAIARELAQRQINLVLVARREERLESLADELRQHHGVTVTPMALDLSRPDAAQSLVNELAQQSIEVDWLVNNAGIGVPGAYRSVPWQTHSEFLQLMVTTVAELTWRLLPGMRERGSGKVINIASLAGLVPPAGGHTLYGAVKSWLVQFSQALAHEVRDQGVTVTAVCPGFTYSEFHDVNGMRDKVSQMPRMLWMSSEAVARQAIEAADRGKILYVNGRLNRLIWRLARFLPQPLFLRLSRSQNQRFRDIG